MTILVLGNGFDLAHGLKTNYKDFLDFTAFFMKLYPLSLFRRKLYMSGSDSPIASYIDSLLLNENPYASEYYNLVADNFWISYFMVSAGFVGSKWIDFEAEISRILRQIEADQSLEGDKHKGEARSLTNALAKNIFKKELEMDPLFYEDIFDRMETDLRKLIRAFEIYLSLCVDKDPIEEKKTFISEIRPDKVLTFNYTNTYERVYESEREHEYGRKVEICHIHGIANEANTFEKDTTNIVLGIDEYLSDEEKNEKLDHIGFKKYYQRITKCTGNEYLLWVDNIKETWEKAQEKKKELALKSMYVPGAPSMDDIKDITHKLFIYGHSLGKTDGDILQRLICNDNVQTTIFYYKKENYESQVRNLVQIIGQDELIKRTGGKTKTIWFKQQ